MASEKTVTLKLKEPIINPDGSVLKDMSKEDRSQEILSKLTPKQIMDYYPPFTTGAALFGLINKKANMTDMEEISKLSHLLTKIRNKLETAKGEWNMEKKDLLDIKEVFDKADPKTLNVNVHGQIYNRIQDLLIQIQS